MNPTRFIGSNMDLADLALSRNRTLWWLCHRSNFVDNQFRDANKSNTHPETPLRQEGSIYRFGNEL